MAALSLATVIGGGAAAPALAGPVIPRLPKTSAAANTPRVVDDSVVTEAGIRELRQVGATMYAGGAVHTVLNSNGSRTYIRNNVFSFNAKTRRMSTWAPVVNGTVYAMASSADGRYLYIGGDFTSYNGHPVNHLLKYDRRLNRLAPGFAFHMVTNRVSDLEVIGNRLFVAGNIAGGVAAVNLNTGVRGAYFNSTRAAGQNPGYTTRVYRFAVNPAHTRLVVLGSFTSVGGQPRQQAALLRLGRRASMTAWTSPRWNETCDSDLLFYTRDVDWSPDGSGFAIVTSGGGFPGTDKLCDTASYWRPTLRGDQQPVWVNYSGGDTFHSVNVTSRGVFVSGHFRWLNNPQGKDSAGPGAVTRHGIAVLNRTNGTARVWNPGKSLEGGLGGFKLYITSRGLWVGDFERYLGTDANGLERHDGLGLLPY